MTKQKLTIQNRILFGLVGLLGVCALVIGVSAYSGTAKVVVEGDYIEAGQTIAGEPRLGAYSSDPTYLDTGEWTRWNDGYFDDLETEDDLWVGDDLTVLGDVAVTGEITGLMDITAVDNTVTTTATTTLTVANSGNNYVITSVSSTVFVLPTTSTASGVHYRFTVGGALTGDVTVRTSDLGDNIEGTLIVAGAVVNCDAEDTITFVSDGENIGDYFEIYSDGTYWYLGDSGALTASKLTCSTT